MPTAGKLNYPFHLKVLLLQRMNNDADREIFVNCTIIHGFEKILIFNF
jgi:hypothetical protein